MIPTRGGGGAGRGGAGDAAKLTSPRPVKRGITTLAGLGAVTEEKTISDELVMGGVRADLLLVSRGVIGYQSC